MTLRSFAVFAALACALPAVAFEMPSREAPRVSLEAPVSFRAPREVAAPLVMLRAPEAKSLPSGLDDAGRLRIGTVRPLPKAAHVTRWTKTAGGYVARFTVHSDEALGLRVRLDLGTLPGAIEARVQGDTPVIATRVIDPVQGPEAWTPWTEGATQTIELFSVVAPDASDAVQVGAVVHFTDSPLLAKAAGSCTRETTCAPTDPTLASGLGAAIVERANSVPRLLFQENGSAFVCSGTLINTEKFPVGYILTANHCIDNATVAATVELFWFDESNLQCPTVPLARSAVPVGGGTQLVFTNYNVDSTLLLMNDAPPPGAVYAGWNPAHLAGGDTMVSISHPKGDSARYAVGSVSGDYRVTGWPQLMYGIRFSNGIIEAGSSGSGLFTLTGGSLQLRGILTGTTLNNSADGMSCTDLNEQALYSRFEIFEPEIEPYIRAAGVAPDDAPNRPQDWFGVAPDPTGAEVLDHRTAPMALDNRAIDYAGDLDVYRFSLAASAWVSTWTEGANLDTVGNILDSRGVNLEYNDDAQASDNHFGITRRLDAGTYYVQVAHWEPQGTGAYNLRLRADVLDPNYTDLWWNAVESGWGLNVNHQGNLIFATLFTYDANGAGMWLVLSRGERQADGSYAGTLYRSRGAPFDTQPFPSTTATPVGSMRIAFTSSSEATLSYTADGVAVTKSITRQDFGTPPTCTWSAFDRSFATNYQDLWWNPAEPGWGVNVTHHGSAMFATLFTYDAQGRGMWLVMPNGSGSSSTFSGTLYRTSGPAFNATPWTPIASTAVGTMSFAFSDGNHGTLTYSVDGVTVTKAIERETFDPLRPKCGA